jgi:hypothetical protein
MHLPPTPGERRLPAAAAVISALGLPCRVLFAAEKAMVDEIGREMALGWKTTGE